MLNLYILSVEMYRNHHYIIAIYICFQIRKNIIQVVKCDEKVPARIFYVIIINNNKNINSPLLLSFISTHHHQIVPLFNFPPKSRIFAIIKH
jgi:hypothetical protein